jgi:hypothetical protein
LLDTGIFLLVVPFPVVKAGLEPGFTVVDLFLFFWSSNYFAFYYLALSANLNATVLAIFLICCCRLFKHPRKLKFLAPCLQTLFLL